MKKLKLASLLTAATLLVLQTTAFAFETNGSTHIMIAPVG